MGYTSGAAMAGGTDNMRLWASLTSRAWSSALADHGSRYMNKIYSDKWMKENGFIE